MYDLYLQFLFNLGFICARCADDDDDDDEAKGSSLGEFHPLCNDATVYQ